MDYRSNGEKLADEMTKLVNTLGGSEEADVFVRAMMRQHRTLQQKFFKEIVLAYIEEVCNAPDSAFDARNEATRTVCEGLARFLLENGYATRERDVDGSRPVRVLEMPFI